LYASSKILQRTLSAVENDGRLDGLSKDQLLHLIITWTT